MSRTGPASVLNVQRVEFHAHRDGRHVVHKVLHGERQRIRDTGEHSRANVGNGHVGLVRQSTDSLKPDLPGVNVRLIIYHTFMKGPGQQKINVCC